MNSLEWKQQSKRTYTLEDPYGKVHLTLENHTCSESNITEAFLEECKQDFLADEKQKGRTQWKKWNSEFKMPNLM